MVWAFEVSVLPARSAILDSRSLPRLTTVAMKVGSSRTSAGIDQRPGPLSGVSGFAILTETRRWSVLIAVSEMSHWKAVRCIIWETYILSIRDCEPVASAWKVKSFSSGFVWRQPSMTPIFARRSLSAAVAAALSGRPGSRSRLSSTKFKSPNITSGRCAPGAEYTPRRSVQKSPFVVAWFGAYTFRRVSVWSPCHGIVILIARPGIISFATAWSVFVMSRLITKATPAAFGLSPWEWIIFSLRWKRVFRESAISSVMCASWTASIPIFLSRISCPMCSHLSLDNRSLPICPLPLILRDAIRRCAFVFFPFFLRPIRGPGVACGPDPSWSGCGSLGSVCSLSGCGGAGIASIGIFSGAVALGELWRRRLPRFGVVGPASDLICAILGDWGRARSPIPSSD